ncbi:TonB-dependent receptor [Acidomonas methanolica]|uniref:TonB-dependent receptor n=2 Tax=Acidomonas methanolica TaxID=437 RepID=A0A023D6A4_ACIMT|nr:TonB-dependent receptor [Acidomonas methanolica]TCS24432.1 iron complex outermembrane receptor protein [Acidomonas methanolica]GAJ29270.1 TonB-dependent receptor [Acidomonas methanolica NBRC 104435]GBQ48557.1 TonB-dependent receptor [Acidomonas methanolica]GEK99897.1 TonB-dependent receptor [Acidomonas methanolica NBRC 104435]
MLERRILLCFAALVALDAGFCRTSFAQSQTPAGKSRTTHRHSPSRSPAPTPRTASPVNGRAGTILGPSVPQTEEISVSGAGRHADGTTNTTPGGGLMPVQTAPRSQSGVTRDWIAKQAPSGNISSMIANLPGVVYANQSPLATAGDHITMRGMNESQIGYLFEGAPLADPINYEPYTSMLVDTENLGSVTVSQGAPDLNAPLFNAVGGQISATELNPSHHAGGYLNLLGGTHSAQKEFLRLDTGEIGNTGIRGFASFSYLSNNNWRGPGGLTRYHVDSKFVKEWGQGNSITAIFGFNRQEQTSWREPTAAQWKEYGTSFNYTPNYYPGNSTYYKLNFGNLNSLDVIAPMHFTLAHNLTLNVTPYFVHQNGPSVGGENIPASGGYYGTYQYGNLGQPYAYTNSSGKQMLTTASVDPWNQKTGAVNTSVDWTAGKNTLSFGYWYSYTTHEELSTFSVVDPSGKAANSYGRYPIVVNGVGILSGYNLNFMQQVNALYLADSLRLLNDKLVVSAGFRAAMVYRQGTNDVPGSDPYKKTGNYFEPLPQFAVSYQITPQDQVYMNGTTSFRAPESVEAYSQIFDPNSSHAVEQPGSLKSEYTIAEELGYRHTDKLFNFQMSLFNINLTNHQVTSSGYIPNTNMLISEPINVGGMTSRGVQGELGLKPWHHFSPYISAQYLHSTMDNNIPASGINAAGQSVIDYLPTAGKNSVGAPHFTFSAALAYDDNKAFFGNFSLRYIGSQYSTFMNDQRMPGYVVSDITLGYRFPHVRYLKGPKIQLNLVNVGNNLYRSAPGSFAATAQTRKGIYGSTISGGSPVYLVGGNFAALVSLSTGF